MAQQLIEVDENMPRGLAGAEYGLRKLADAIDRARVDPLIIEDTRQVLMAAGALEPRGRPDPTKIVRAIVADGKKRVGFVRDPVDCELFIAPRYQLCLDPSGPCVPAGDCDDQVLRDVARIASAGIPVRVVVRFYKGQGLSHLTFEYDRSMKLAEDWVCVDPSREDGRCSDMPFVHEIIMEIHMGNDRAGTFVGMGEEPGHVWPSTMGADDARKELSPAESDVWTARVEDVRDELARSVGKLRAEREALIKVRSILGRPAADPTPPPSSEGPDPLPLRSYAQTFKWTKEAQEQEAKLISAGDYAESILSDALAGKRPMYFQDNDILIGALPNDPYYLLWRKNARGESVPSFVDPKTGDSTGQMGNPVIIVAGAVVVVALALSIAWNMDKLIDFMAQRHHDEMLSDMFELQAKMVEKGYTPDQIAQLTNANAEVSKASTIYKGGQFPWGTMILVALLAAVAGVGVAVAVDKIPKRSREAVA